MTKTCTKCGATKAIDQFVRWNRSPDGRHHWCKPCKYGQTNELNASNREALLDLYGRQCRRCGFDDERALQVDHVNGGGTQHWGRINHNRTRFTKDVLAHPERFQLLCANCNAIKKFAEDQAVV